MRSQWWRVLAGALVAAVLVYALPYVDSPLAGGVLHASMLPVGRIGEAVSTLPEPEPEAGAQPPAAMAQQHTVQQGETLTSISVLYGVDPRQVASMNGIRNPDRLFCGQVLMIPAGQTASVYTVRAGDTLGRIARQYDVSVADLAAVNRISDTDLIKVGQRLMIPGELMVADAGGQTSRFALGLTPMSWPIIGLITSAFGYRWGRLHSGIDIAARYGTPVTAVSNGVVTFAGKKGSYGNLVILTHPDGLTSYYGHLSRIEVERGMDVLAGETIGRLGATGNSTGPHLHFEVRRGSQAINPRKLLP